MTKTPIYACLIVVAAFAACSLSSRQRSVVPGHTSLDNADAIAALRSITAEEARHHVSVLAADSLRGRDTREPEIWRAAQYLADEFIRMGLEPVGESFIHPYEAQDVRLLETGLLLRLTGDRTVEILAGSDLAVLPGDVDRVSGPVRFVGRLSAQAAPVIVDVDGAVVLAVLSVEAFAGSNLWYSFVGQAAEAGALAVGFVFQEEPPFGMMEALLDAQRSRGIKLDRPVFFVRPGAAHAALRTIGVSLASLQSVSDTEPGLPLVELQAPVEIKSVQAPNVLGVIRGRHSTLRESYVVVTAHFDHVGVGEPNAGGDSVYNGANDNASGTAGLLEIADAFSELADVLPRSVLFAAVSGEEIGLQGSRHLLSHEPISSAALVAALNLDTVGDSELDRLGVLGQELSSLGVLLQDILIAHPTLGLQVPKGSPWPDIDYLRFGDHLSFLEHGVPSLFFFSGDTRLLHTPGDQPERVDGELIARVAKLGFLLTHAIANDNESPYWTQRGVDRLPLFRQGMPRRHR